MGVSTSVTSAFRSVTCANLEQNFSFSPAHLLLLVFGKTSMALGICCLLASKRSALRPLSENCIYLDRVFSESKILDVPGRRSSN